MSHSSQQRDDHPGRTTRVLHLIKGLGPGGAERLIVNQMLTTAGAIDYHVAYTVPEKSHLVDELEDLGVPVTLLDSNSPLALWRHLRTVRPDVVHVHSPVLAVVVRLLKATRLTRAAVMTTEHNRWPRHHRATRAANRITASLDDHRIAVSEDVKSSMSAAASAGTVLLDHGVPFERIAASGDRRAARWELLGGHPDERVIIGIVANFRPEKAYDTFAKAAELALSTNDNIALVVIGQGPGEEAFREEAARLSDRFDGRLSVLGYRPDARMLMSGFDVFTLTSRHEGKPVSIMEAFAHGLPVVATRAGGIPEAIKDGANGLLVDVDDWRAIAAAWVRIATDEPLRHQLAKGAAASSSRFDAAEATRSIESAYRSLVASGRTG